ILIVSALLVPLTIIIIKKVLPMLVTDIADFTSFSTRITTIVAMVKSIFLYPFGEGYGTYLLYFPPLLLPTNAQIVHIIGFPLQPGELIDMVNTGKNLPAKSGVGNEIIYNGITAIIFLVLICRYYVKNVRLIPIKSARLIFSFLGLLLLTIFTFNTILETAYFYLLPLVIVPKLVNTGNTP
ncbi:MAG TPA: hypothetical protein VHB48_02990, partial [Chitinophagaceae bacterium]|nr:hypothetical protein [Chitinophagaceae bacterium]